MRVTVSLLVACACGGAAKPPAAAPVPAPEPEPRNNTFAFADEICACSDMQCADDVQKKYARQPHDQPKPPTDEEMAALKRLMLCMANIANPPPRSTGVAECDQVVAAYEKLFSCDKFKNMPQEAIDAQRSGLETMKSSWHFDTDRAKEAARPNCVAALDGLLQSAAAMGCPL